MMNTKAETSTKKNQILTIPNILSFIRLALIPVIIWMYCVEENLIWTAVILVLSGITDLVDGYIARRFHMVSDFGKALDPIADKLTQLAMLFCLVLRFPMMAIPFGLLLVKEVVSGALGLWIIKKTNIVRGADWHGKVTTVLLYAMMTLHVLWFNIPMAVSNATIILCTLMMMFSFILYSRRNITILKCAK